MNLLIIIAANEAAHSRSAIIFHAPKRIPRIRMASAMLPYSSPTVGKNRNITDIGIVIFCGMCIRSMEAMNSLTVGRSDHIGSHRDTRHEPRRDTQRNKQEIHRAVSYLHKQCLRDVSHSINSGVDERRPEFPFRQQENKRDCGQRPAQGRNEYPAAL